MMIPPDPKKPQPHRGTGSTTSSASKPSKHPIIATPPRVALRAKHETSTSNEAASTKPSQSKSKPTKPNTNTAISGTRDPEDGEADPAAKAEEAQDEAEDAKDAKAQITALQNELSIMESEFSHELGTLSQKLTNAHESTQFWASKHSLLNQNFLKSDTEVRVLRGDIEVSNGKVEGLVAERERWRAACEGVLGERDGLLREKREKEEVLREREREVSELREQVRGLKSWVSRGGRGGDEQVSDEVFGEGMGRLGNGLQNWVIVHFRRVRVDAEKANDETRELLLRLIPTYESLAATSKIHFIQSLVSRLLVESIFRAYFVGVSKEQADELQKVEKYLSDFGPVESINTWRSTTLAILRKDACQKLQTETTAIVESIVHQINSIMTSISDVQASETRDQALRALINSSIELSRLLRVQKAVFTITMPSLEGHQRTMFDKESMEDIGGEDEDTLSDRELRCVTFPGIVKAGDENGERGYLRNVVAKIRVLCAPD